MLVLLSDCFGVVESSEGERGSLFEFGVCTGSDLTSA
jgi:hypothetical protein